MKITTRVVVQIIETDEDFPHAPESQQRQVQYAEALENDGVPPSEGAVAFAAGVAAGRAVNDLKRERELHPRQLQPVES